MKKIFCLCAFALFVCAGTYAQNLEETVGILSQAAQMVNGKDVSSAGGLLAGFSIWSLLAGLVFSGIGFIAFVYGKKNAEWPTMIIGICLMVYPYFIVDAFLSCMIGSALTAAIFVLRRA